MPHKEVRCYCVKAGNIVTVIVTRIQEDVTLFLLFYEGDIKLGTLSQNRRKLLNCICWSTQMLMTAKVLPKRCRLIFNESVYEATMSHKGATSLNVMSGTMSPIKTE